MPISLGTTTVTALYLGTTSISSAYLGNTQVFSSSTFSPSSLFAASEPGVWYDPSDLTTLFQDTAGTTPVTTAGQTVALLLDKSKAQAVGPELVTNGTFATNLSGWTATAAWTWDAGEAKGIVASSGDTLIQTFATLAPGWVEFGYRVTSGSLRCAIRGADGIYSTLIANTLSGTGTFRAFVSQPFDGIQFARSGAGTMYVDNVSVKQLPGNHATQATAASRPTYQVDGGGRPYLSFDGVDDFMVTPMITPGTDKAQVFAGVRKLSDAARGSVVELTTSAASNNGALQLTAPEAASATFAFISKGTAQATATATSLAAPITRVLCGLADIAGDSAIIRVNAVQAAQDTTDQGTGSFTAAVVYIGRRAGTSLPFSGQIYSLITRFGANLSAGQIADTETWVNGKTGAY